VCAGDGGDVWAGPAGCRAAGDAGAAGHADAAHGRAGGECVVLEGESTAFGVHGIGAAAARLVNKGEG